MNTATKQLLLGVGSLVAVGGFLAWWVLTQTTPPALTSAPAITTTTSPLTSPVIDSLRSRSIFGDLPVQPVTASGRTDPFIAQ